MTYEVRVTNRAEMDIDTIFNWLAQRSREGAIRWYHAYVASLYSLPMQALGCGIAPEADSLGVDLRQVLFKYSSRLAGDASIARFS